MTNNEWRIILDKEPYDWDLREMYAVWLQDDADDLLFAQCQRWMIRNMKVPGNDNYPRYGGNKEGYSWDWWKGTESTLKIPRYLLSTIFGLLPTPSNSLLMKSHHPHWKSFSLEQRSSVTRDYREYPSSEEAERVLCQALVVGGIISGVDNED